LTKHISGDADCYGETFELGDLDIIANTFKITGEKDKLRQIMENNNVIEKIDALEKLLKIDLWGNDIDKWKKVTIK